MARRALAVAVAGISAGLAMGGLLYWARRRARARAREPVYISTVEACTAVAQRLMARVESEGAMVLGVDAEWRPSGRGEPSNPVAVLQLSPWDEPALIVHLSRMDFVPRELEALLADPRVLKTGVGISGDKRKLWADHGLQLVSTVELANLALDNGFGKAGLGLRALTAEICGELMEKSKEMQMSQWDAPVLSPGQLAYAAADSDASRDVFLALWRHCSSAARAEGRPPPTVLELAAPYLDLTASTGAGGERQSTRRSSGPAEAPYSAVYDNCAVLRPNGKLMAWCSKAKWLWYLEKGLAQQIDENTIQLNFEPRFPEHDGDSYYVSRKESKCVICASETTLSRYHVVPVAFRRHFPLHLKAHASHDVVLLCSRCQPNVERGAREQRDALSAELGVDPAPELAWAQHYGRVQSMASLLLRELKRGKPLSEKSKRVLPMLNEWLGRGSIADMPALEQLEQLAALSKETTGFKDNARLVYEKFVERYGDTEASHALSVLWRQHFIDFARPAHMPDRWSVHHRDHPREIEVREGKTFQIRRSAVTGGAAGPSSLEEGASAE